MSLLDKTLTPTQISHHTIKPWCGDHIGPGRVIKRDADTELTGEEVWYCEQYYGFANFYFINSTDATLFRLKWL